MKTVTIHDAKTNLSKLIQEACEGEEIIISRGDEAVVRLVALTDAKRHRKPGSLKGKFQVGKKFFEPLPEDELKAWE